MRAPAVERRYIEKVRAQFYAALRAMPVPVSSANFLAYGASTTPTLVLIDPRRRSALLPPGGRARSRSWRRESRNCWRSSSRSGLLADAHRTVRRRVSGRTPGGMDQRVDGGPARVQVLQFALVILDRIRHLGDLFRDNIVQVYQKAKQLQQKIRPDVDPLTSPMLRILTLVGIRGLTFQNRSRSRSDRNPTSTGGFASVEGLSLSRIPQVRQCGTDECNPGPSERCRSAPRHIGIARDHSRAPQAFECRPASRRKPVRSRSRSAR